MRSLANLRLLLVEDDVQVNRATERLLSRVGHKVTACKCVGEALELAESFDCAVLDIDLPDGDGVTLAQRLLDDGTVPLVVFYSGTTDHRIGARALALGPFVPKSAGGLELAKTISDWVSRAACDMVAGAEAQTVAGRGRPQSGARRRFPR
jgi:CheY-like chemotaxis protein